MLGEGTRAHGWRSGLSTDLRHQPQVPLAGRMRGVRGLGPQRRRGPVLRNDHVCGACGGAGEPGMPAGPVHGSKRPPTPPAAPAKVTKLLLISVLSRLRVLDFA